MEHSVFAMELCLRMEPGSTLRQELHGVVVNAQEKMSLHGKWQQYHHASSILQANLDRAEKGCWDFFDDDARARRDYDMWCNGMLTEEGARKSPSGPVDPYRGEPRYLTFTMAFLIENGSPTNQMLAKKSDIPQARLWERESFRRLLRAVSAMSFASVKSDVVYLIPRDEGWGLTLQDLQDPKFHYLRPIVG